MSQERIAINLRNWRGKSTEEIVQDLASFPIESADLPSEKRISVTVLKLSSFAKLINPLSQSAEDIATTKIYMWAKDANPQVQIWLDSNEPSEKEILQEMKTLIDFNPGQLIIWLSPAEKGVYDESRIGIYQVVLVNNEKYLFFRSLCGNQYLDKCSVIAKRLTRNSVEIIIPEELSDPRLLRACPISIYVPGKSLLGYLKSAIEIPNVWQAISNGEDIDKKINSTAVVSAFLTGKVEAQIEEAQLFNQQVIIGAWIEKELQERLNITLKPGSCGVLYSSLTISPLTQILGNRESVSLESGAKFVKNCGNCGTPINARISKGYVCPHCGGVYEGC